MKTIGIIGYKGFIGSAIFDYFSLEPSYKVYGIPKDEDSLVKDFDILINANGNTYKYLAEQNPYRDFDLSVRTVYESIIRFNFEKYIYISSIDAEDEINTYGKNRVIAEKVVQTLCRNYNIIRLCAVIGKGMKKGIVKDILENNPSYLTLDSELYLITVNEVARILFDNIDIFFKNQVIKLYSKKSITVRDIFKITNKPLIVRSDVHHESYFCPGTHMQLCTSEEYLKQIL